MNPTDHQTQVHQVTQRMIEEPPAKRRESSKKTCLGTPLKTSQDNQEIPAQLNPDKSSSISEIISPQLKKWISVTHTALRGFHPSERENIAKGKSVNLDIVLSSLHHIAPIKENLRHMGSTEISLGHTEPTRRVQTSGEWTSAWNSTIKATTFI